MDKQIFGNTGNNKKEQNNRSFENKKYEYKPLEEHISPQKFFIIICLIVFGLCCLLSSDKSSVLYCNIPEDNCELTTEPVIGTKEVRKVLNPSEIKDFYIYSHCRHRGGCYVSLYFIDKNDDQKILYTKDTFSLFMNSRRNKFKQAGKDIKYLLENKKEFKYDLLHAGNKS